MNTNYLYNTNMDHYQSYYNDAILVEDDMRKNMYLSENGIYNDMHYELSKLNDDFWNNLEITIPEENDILTPKNRLVKQPYNTIMENISKLNNIFSIDGIFLAGGAIFSIIFGLPINDLDIFIYGCDEKVALKKIHAILALFDYSILIRTSNTVSCKIENNELDVKEVQFILRLYKTKSEILHGFDLDSCCFGYDGKDIWMTKRAECFLRTGMNHVNFDRLSPSYEFRLAKYLHRGVGIKIPNFDKSRINIDGIKESLDLYTPIGFLVEKGVIKGLDIILIIYYYIHYTDNKDIEYICYGTNDDRIMSDYGACNIGDYTLTTIYDLFRDIGYNFSELNERTSNLIINRIHLPSEYRRSVYFIGTENTYYGIYDLIELDSYVYDILSTLFICNFPRKLEWKVTNPGEQMTGTFHRTILEDTSLWYGNRCYEM